MISRKDIDVRLRCGYRRKKVPAAYESKNCVNSLACLRGRDKKRTRSAYPTKLVVGSSVRYAEGGKSTTSNRPSVSKKCSLVVHGGIVRTTWTNHSLTGSPERGFTV